MLARRLLLLVAFACVSNSGCDDAKNSTQAGDAASTDDHAAIKKKIIGVWIAQGDTEETYELTASRYKAVYPKAGGNPIVGPYTIVEVEGDKVTIKPSLEMDDGKAFPVDEQIITIIDADTIDRRNAKNNSGSTFKRKK